MTSKKPFGKSVGDRAVAASNPATPFGPGFTAPNPKLKAPVLKRVKPKK